MKQHDETWYDHNRKQDRIEMGSEVAIMIGWAWAWFTFGVWLVISFFWDSGGPGQVSDGGETDRHVFTFVTSLFGVIPCALAGIYRAAVDAAEAKKRVELAAVKEATTQVKDVEIMEVNRQPGFHGIALGHSTGMLASRGHYSGIRQGSKVHLSPNDACKNIVIFGGIGSGKTTGFINPIMHQVLQQDCSALVFDIKGDFRRELDYIAGRVERKYVVVGDGGLTLNLFRGCTPEVAASYLKSCFIAGGAASGNGAFWADTATNYCRNLLTLLKLADGDYSIAGLADLVFSEDRRMETMMVVREREKAGQLAARDVRIWNAVLSYMVDTVAKWEDKFRGAVQGTCEAVLNPFISPDLVDAFSVESVSGEADLYALLNEPTVYLVNLPRHKFGANGARFAYLLIKLRFFTMMAERRARLELNQDRYVAFLCDEYQGIVDSVSDTDFWDKSRSSKCFGILSMQGVSSLVQAVGDPKAADAILQNWRQRAIARTEDGATLEMAQRLLGQVDVHLTAESFSYSENVSVSKDSHSTGSSESQSTSSSIQRQNVFDANDARKLDAKYALFIGNLGDGAADDVLEVTPYYIP